LLLRLAPSAEGTPMRKKALRGDQRVFNCRRVALIGDIDPIIRFISIGFCRWKV